MPAATRSSPPTNRPSCGTWRRSARSLCTERSEAEGGENDELSAFRLPPSEGAITMENDERENETERGLRFAHIMMMVGQSQGNQSLAAIMALADLLVAKGVIS